MQTVESFRTYARGRLECTMLTTAELPPPAPLLEPTDKPLSLTERFLVLYRRWMPIFSIVTGVIGVWQMQDYFDQIRYALIALALGLAILVVENKIRRMGPLNRLTGQVIFENLTWFMLPFYLRSASATVGSIVTVMLLAALSVTWSWQPWLDRLEEKQIYRAALRSVSAFFVLNMAISTVFSWSLSTSWWLSSVFAALGFAAFGLNGGTLTGSIIRGGALMALGVLAYVWQPMFPPVPMRLDEVRWEPSRPAAGSPITLHTSVVAPQGLDERLEHRWYHGQELTDTIPLVISGGRKEGFRTRSHKENWPADSRGDWHVDVVTDDGRLLGRVKFEIP